jgi:cation diffusion facilitator family transporter
MDANEKNIRVQQIVVTLAVLLFGIKLTAYFITHSVAILTDALESIVNVVAGFFGLYSLSLSAKPKDLDHPYGHGKIEFISAAVEGTLITIAGLLIMREAVSNLFHPQAFNELDWGIGLIAITAILNYVIGSACIRIGSKNNSIALVAGGKHLHTDTYSTLGIIAGLILIYFTNLLWIDSAVAIVFGLIIIFTGYSIIRKSMAGIMDESDNELMNRLVQLLNENRRENWMDIHNTRVIKFGSVLHLDAHLTVPWYFNVQQAHDEIDALAKLVRNEFGETLELYVHTDPCVEFSCRICIKHDCQVRKHPLERRKMWTVENITIDQKHQVNSEP